MMLSTSQMLGKELLCSSIATIAHTLSGTLGAVVQFVYHEDQFKHLANDIAELNLKTDIALLDVIVEHLESTQARPPSRCLQLSIQHLHHALSEMHQALQNLHRQMEAHRQLWFSAYRSFDAEGHLRLLRLCKQRLDHHFDRLVTVRQLFPR
jgi:hypothetical protein